MTLRAYLDALTAEPGGSLAVHVSGRGAVTVAVDEYLHSDPHPDSPGVRRTRCDWGSGELQAVAAPARLGSHAVTDALPVDSDGTISCWIWPTDLTEEVVLASWTGREQRWSLRLSATGLALVGDGEEYRLDQRIRERIWSFVGVAWGGARELRPTGTTLFASPWGRTGGPFTTEVAGLSVAASTPTLWLGSDGAGTGQLDGRVAGLRVHDCALDIVELSNVMNGTGVPPLVTWDLADRRDPDLAPAAGPGEPLRLVHAPLRSSQVPDPVESSGRALAGNGSVHFHRDDTEDCGWPVGHRVRVPDGAPPGLYAVELTGDAETLELPFVVRGSGEVTLLVPTLTWQAYANLGRDGSWPGLSHYALHSDGSPVAVTTSRRPSQTFAPAARLEVEAGDGFATGVNATHLMMADLYAWWWLHEEFDGRIGVTDDRDLHLRGEAALRDVRVLVLSAHPEYWTGAMLDALEAHLSRGASVVYLGGNGLYWVTSLHPTKPHLMELRRWGGSQTWSIEEVDRQHQFEDRLGGLWAEAGRPPNATVGVGFAGFGNGPSLPFTRTAESYRPELAWLFDGVDANTFGAGGLNTGAGNEFDAYDPALRPAGESVVVASSAPSDPDHFATFEGGGQRAPSPSVRSDVVLTRTPAGGHVLAFSSITASGCLVSRNDTKLARVAGNAVRRMLAER